MVYIALLCFIIAAICIVLLVRMRKKRTDKATEEVVSARYKIQHHSKLDFSGISTPSTPRPVVRLISSAPGASASIVSRTTSASSVYRYIDVNVFTPSDLLVDYSDLNIGDEVSVTIESDNQYDAKAVLIIHNTKRIGYLYRGKLKDMVYDFISASSGIRASIYSVDIPNKRISLELSLQRDGNKKATAKEFRLTGNLNADMQSTISYCSVGDTITYVLDPDNMKYAALYGVEIGFFPKSAEYYLERGYKVSVSKIEENDKGKYIVYVRVRLEE